MAKVAVPAKQIQGNRLELEENSVEPDFVLDVQNHLDDLAYLGFDVFERELVVSQISSKVCDLYYPINTISNFGYIGRFRLRAPVAL